MILYAGLGLPEMVKLSLFFPLLLQEGNKKYA